MVYWDYLDEGDKNTEDCEVNDDLNRAQNSTVAASGGVLYRLDSGYLYAYDNNGGWNKFYKVDSSYE